MDRNGNNAGRIYSLVLDTRNGSVDYVMVAGRDDFNLNGQLVAVRWSDLQQPAAKGAITINLSANQLQQRPRINRNFIYQLNSPGGRAGLRGNGNYPPYYRRYGRFTECGPYPGGWIGYAGQNARNGQAPQNGTTTPQSGAGNNNQNPQQAQNGQPGGGNTNNFSGPGPAGPPSSLTVDRNGVVSVLLSAKSVSPQGLRSANVYAHGRRVGHIDQVMIDTSRGDVAYLLLERGGFLGLNPTWFALPIEALSWSRYSPDYGYRLTVNVNLLDDVPPVPVNRGHLPTKVAQSELAQLYNHFGIAPYWQQTRTSNNTQRSASTGR